MLLLKLEFNINFNQLLDQLLYSLAIIHNK